MPLVLFALPDEEARKNRLEIAIPNGASLILKHHADGVVPGLDDFEGEHPPVAPVFWSFRVMVGVGFLMLGLSWLAAWQLWRRGEPSPLVTRALVAMTFSGWVATVAGWFVTEIGRQPWLVYGVLTTHEAASDVPAAMIATTFLGYMAVYAFLLAAYVGTLFYLAGKGRTADVTVGGPGAVPEAGEVAAEAALGHGAPARA